MRRKPPRPRPERPRSSRIKVAQTRGGWWARQRCRLCPAWQLPMGSRGVWASTESLLEDRKGELDKGLSVRKHLPILFKRKLKCQENKGLVQGHRQWQSQDKNSSLLTSSAHLPAPLRCLLHFISEAIKAEAEQRMLCWKKEPERENSQG